MTRPLKVALLTVSDTCAVHPDQDKSGPKLRSLFESLPGNDWLISETAICADSVNAIQKQLTSWTDGSQWPNVIFTTGGTGFAQRDVTPEAVKPLLDREAPGLVHAMFQESFRITPLAGMARLVAGVRKKTLIITVPGSPKGAVENAQAIVPLLKHACDLAADNVDSRKLHSQGFNPIAAPESKSFSTDELNHTCPHAVSHGHHHRSNDPNAGVVGRARSSPFPMISVDKALQLIMENCPSPKIVEVPIVDDGRFLIDYVVARTSLAKEAVPAYRASIVDGYAVIAADGAGTYPVVSVAHAKRGTLPGLCRGQIARVTTGAPIPDGCDSIVMVEDTEIISTTGDGKEEATVAILVKTKTGNNIRDIGSDVKEGSVIMSQGERITGTGGEVGILASSGNHSIPVYTRPRVGVLSTGDELVDPGNPRELHGGEIRDTNRISLLTTISSWNFEAVDLGIAKDTSSDLQTVLEDALSRCDVVITTGGVSMGEKDLLKPTIERSLQGTIHFGRVAMKPGKPTTFATVPVSSEGPKAPAETAPESKAFFALPGNPASALVTFHLFVLPYLRKFSGFSEQEQCLAQIKTKVSQDIKLDSRPEYHRAMISVNQDGVLVARSTGGQRSSRVGSLCCNALLCLPASTSDVFVIKAGSLVDTIMIDALRNH